MQIKHVHIRNFRSLSDEQIELPPLSVLVGKNDAGKSNALEAIRLLLEGSQAGRDRIAAITVPYTQPRSTKAFKTSSGYVLIPAVGKNCKDNGCATKATLQAFVPQTATVTKVSYWTSAENGPNNDDIPMREVQPGKDIGWSFIQPAVPKTYPNIPNTVVYETVFFNRSNDRAREAALVVEYTMP